jgi:hypothetical protein
MKYIEDSRGCKPAQRVPLANTPEGGAGRDVGWRTDHGHQEEHRRA